LTSSSKLLLVGSIVDAKLLKAKLTWQAGERKDFAVQLTQLEKQHLDDMIPAQQLEWFGLLTDHYAGLQQADELLDLSERVRKQLALVRQSLDSAHLGPVWTSKADRLVRKAVTALMAMADKSNDRQLRARVYDLLAQKYAINLRERRYEVANYQALGQNGFNSPKLEVLWLQRLAAERKVIDSETDQQSQQAQLQLDDATEAYLSFVPPVRNTQLEAALNYLSIEQVQQNLAGDALFLRYYLQDERSFVYIISRDNWSVMDIAARSEITSQLNQLVGQLQQQQLDTEGPIKTLAGLLPLKQLAQGDYRRLIMIHDDALNILPFSALNIAQTPGQYESLNQRFELVRTFSAAEYFAKQQQRLSEPSIDIAIFADPTFDPKQLALGVTQNEPVLRDWSKTLARLQYSAQEAKGIAQSFSGGTVSVVTN
ncbi:MAG: CHAT domain-containing protein, partial [Psychrosphaera sp.]|nr:CHAT domain-containing protein [Psychrosphaera sp.]